MRFDAVREMEEGGRRAEGERGKEVIREREMEKSVAEVRYLLVSFSLPSLGIF